MEYLGMIKVFLPFIFLCYFFRNKNGLPTHWPIIGMLPALLKNVHRIHDFIIELMEKTNSTFHFKGPCFSSMDLLFTVDPANLHYILSKKFGNYVKGSKLNEICDVFGDGILNNDSTTWRYHREVAQSFFNHREFRNHLVSVVLEKIENGLIPILDHVSKHAIEIDLQNVLLRFMYDTMCIIMMDYDPKYLTIDFPYCPFIKASGYIEYAIFCRHVMPTCMWKFLRWLDVGFERKHKQSLKTLDDFIYNCIDMKRKGHILRKGEAPNNYKQVNVDLLTSLIMKQGEYTYMQAHTSDKFLRDTILNFILAGGETTSTALTWFFYLVSKNPCVYDKIKEEINAMSMPLKNYKEISDKQVYFHATICEALRMYPSVVFIPKTPVEADILPSGHRVNQSTEILFHMYAMGRMKSIWGDDCNEFKPERWILEGGVIKHEPSYKFSVFGAGPRACIGKQMALTQMKIIAAMIIQNYRIEALPGLHVPDVSFVLRMKHGFKVKVSRA